MSRSAEISLDWGGEERTFRLGVKELERLQERCGERGPMRILRDLLNGDWKIRDLTETIRLGLCGGRLKPSKADELIRDYVEDRPLQENVLVAMAILQAAIVGPPIEAAADKPPDQVGEMKAATTGSTSPPCTEPELSSAGAPEKLVN